MEKTTIKKIFTKTKRLFTKKIREWIEVFPGIPLEKMRDSFKSEIAELENKKISILKRYKNYNEDFKKRPAIIEKTSEKQRKIDIKIINRKACLSALVELQDDLSFQLRKEQVSAYQKFLNYFHLKDNPKNKEIKNSIKKVSQESEVESFKREGVFLSFFDSLLDKIEVKESRLGFDNEIRLIKNPEKKGFQTKPASGFLAYLIRENEKKVAHKQMLARGIRNPDDREDGWQRVQTNLLQSIDRENYKTEETGSFPTYRNAIIRNSISKYLDEQKRQKRGLKGMEKISITPRMKSLIENTPDIGKEADIERLLFSKTIRGEINKAIDRIPYPEQKKALKQILQKHRTHREGARALGKNLSAFQGNLNKGLKNLLKDKRLKRETGREN